MHDREVICASELVPERDYPSFPEFREFQLPLHLVDADVLRVLQRLRDLSGVPIIPSPVYEGWARKSGHTTSRHYAVGRLSDAADIFPVRGGLLECWLRAQEISEINGLGLYCDTVGPDGRPWPMMHFDLRPQPRMFWVRIDSTYFNLFRSPASFWRTFKYIINAEGTK